MKRVVFPLILAVVSCLSASTALAQDWAPGPPPSAMPQTGVPMPVMGQPGGMPMPMPGLDSSYAPAPCPPAAYAPPPCGPPVCPPPTCGPPIPGCPSMPGCPPMPCGPSNQRCSVAGMVGWQVNSKLGDLKFSSRGAPVFNLTGQKLDLKTDGLWLGGSARVDMADGLAVRAECRHLFPSQTTVATVTPLGTNVPESRTFNHSRYAWNLLDGSLSYSVACGVSAVGGFRWDQFSLFLSKPPIIDNFSSDTDQGDLTINCYKPYGGAEFAFTGCDTGVLIRAIGSPWISTDVNYGLTSGAGNLRLPWIRDHLAVTSNWASFVEVTVTVGKKIGCDLTVGAFGMINAVWAHSEGNLTSTRDAPVLVQTQPFDVDLNRGSVVLGGNVALSIPSPL